MELSISEVMKMVGLTKKQIQKCEEAKIAIKPKDKNQYGHLIYRDENIERLWQIRFCYEIGYQIKDMEPLFLTSNFDKKKVLDMQISKLSEEIAKKKELIKIAQAMKQTGITFESVTMHSNEFKDKNFNEMYKITLSVLQVNDADEDILFAEMGENEKKMQDDIERVIDVVEEIFRKKGEGYLYDSVKVQEEIRRIHVLFSRYFSESLIAFNVFSLLLVPESKISKKLDDEYGKGKGGYLYNAIQFYISSNTDEKKDCFLFAVCIAECIVEYRERVEAEKAMQLLSVAYEKVSESIVLGEKYKVLLLKKVLLGMVADREAFEKKYGEGAAEYLVDVINSFLEKRIKEASL